jgi:hypothetical protein
MAINRYRTANHTKHIAVINRPPCRVHSKSTEYAGRFDEYSGSNWEAIDLQESHCERMAYTRCALASWKSCFVRIAFRTSWANLGADGEQSMRASSGRSSEISATSVETALSSEAAALTIDTQKVSTHKQFRKSARASKFQRSGFRASELSGSDHLTRLSPV